MRDNTRTNQILYGTSCDNVTDAFGYLYPAKGDVGEHILYFFIMIVLGAMFSSAYVRAKRRDSLFNTYIVNLITYFVFFSFFGTFYINPGPWEMLIYAAHPSPHINAKAKTMMVIG